MGKIPTERLDDLEKMCNDLSGKLDRVTRSLEEEKDKIAHSMLLARVSANLLAEVLTKHPDIGNDQAMQNRIEMISRSLFEKVRKQVAIDQQQSGGVPK